METRISSSTTHSAILSCCTGNCWTISESAAARSFSWKSKTARRRAMHRRTGDGNRQIRRRRRRRSRRKRQDAVLLPDRPAFRQWLYKLDPDEDVDEAVTLWRAQAKTSHAKSAAISWSRPDLPLWSENAKITKKEIKTACIITPRPKPSTGFWPTSKRFTANEEVKV